MPDPTQDVLIKVSSAAAETFTDTYYPALQNARHTIQSFYLPRTLLPDGKTTVPSIVWNGNVFSDSLEFQKMFETQMPYSYFEVQSLDAQIINPNLGGVQDEDGKKRDVENCSILVSVSGFIRLEEKKEGPIKGFSEAVILVPHPERGGKKDVRKWLIQTQNLRYVV